MDIQTMWGETGYLESVSVSYLYAAPVALVTHKSQLENTFLACKI